MELRESAPLLSHAAALRSEPLERLRARHTAARHTALARWRFPPFNWLFLLLMLVVLLQLSGLINDADADEGDLCINVWYGFDMCLSDRDASSLTWASVSLRPFELCPVRAAASGPSELPVRIGDLPAFGSGNGGADTFTLVATRFGGVSGDVAVRVRTHDGRELLNLTSHHFESRAEEALGSGDVMTADSRRRASATVSAWVGDEDGRVPQGLGEVVSGPTARALLKGGFGSFHSWGGPRHSGLWGHPAQPGRWRPWRTFSGYPSWQTGGSGATSMRVLRSPRHASDPECRASPSTPVDAKRAATAADTTSAAATTVPLISECSLCAPATQEAATPEQLGGPFSVRHADFPLRLELVSARLVEQLPSPRPTNPQPTALRTGRRAMCPDGAEAPSARADLLQSLVAQRSADGSAGLASTARVPTADATSDAGDGALPPPPELLLAFVPLTS